MQRAAPRATPRLSNHRVYSVEADQKLITMSLRALQRRVAEIEKARTARASPIVVMFGSFGYFVAVMFQPAWNEGSMEQGDLLYLVELLSGWKTVGTWERARAIQQICNISSS
jgi:hypothetical protein